MKPSWPVTQWPRMSKSCVGLKYLWRGWLLSLQFTLCNLPCHRHTGYAIHSGDMTCYKVPWVKIWHPWDSAHTGAAGAMTVLKAPSHSALSQQCPLREWKHSEISWYSSVHSEPHLPDSNTSRPQRVGEQNNSHSVRLIANKHKPSSRQHRPPYGHTPLWSSD